MAEGERLLKKNVPLIFGEVLFDIFENKNSVPGGAPFNVAWHLQGLGLQPFFVSRVGSDGNGNRIIQRMKDWGMSLRGVQRDDRHPTGTVSVTISNGEPEFDIHPEQAYDFIDFSRIKNLVENKSYPLLYHGTLAIRNEISRNTLKMIKQKTGAKVFLDINIREPWWSSELVTLQLAAANWVKCNADELKLIAEITGSSDENLYELAAKICKIFSLDFLIVTLGEQGAFIIDKNEQLNKSRPRLVANLVDTVGAGDGFSAVSIFGILNNWQNQVILERAVEFAAKICGIRGATLNDHNYYDFILNRWKNENGE